MADAKSTPLKSSVLHSLVLQIDLTEGRLNVRKSSKISNKVDNAKCPIFWTNIVIIGPTMTLYYQEM